jgi:glutamine amidotransferase
MDVVIVDYGLGNLPSVQKALARVGCAARIVQDPAAAAAADGLVLPGVGAFGACMAGIRQAGWVEPLRAFAAGGRPLLGICVGMQVLLEVGEEFGATPGLGLVPGRVTRLPETVKLPHIGWNLVTPVKAHPIFSGISEPFFCYYVHSYAAEQVDPAYVGATTTYGRPYPAMLAKDNLVACQFHPEKSAAAGLQILANFVAMVAAHKEGNARG